MHCILTGAPGEFWLTTSSVFAMLEDSYATTSVPISGSVLIPMVL